MSNNPLSIPAQSSSSISSTNVNIVAKSLTNEVASNKNRYETPKEAKNRINKHRTNVKIIAAYSALAFGLFIVGYLICFYITKIPVDLKQQHLLAIIDYVKANGMPTAFGAMVVGVFMWIFNK